MAVSPPLIADIRAMTEEALIAMNELRDLLPRVARAPSGWLELRSLREDANR